MNYWLERAKKSYKQKELEKLVEKWSCLRMLEDIEDDHIKQQVALIMENQRIMNEVITDHDDLINRFSIPILRRVFGDNKYEEGLNPLFRIISVQGMMAPNDKINVCGEEEVVSAMTRKLKTSPPVPDYSKGSINLNAECDACLFTSQAMRSEIVREVLTDLRRTSLPFFLKNGTKDKLILQAIGQIKNRTGKDGNFWIAGNFENVRSYMGISDLDSIYPPDSNAPTLYKGLPNSILKYVITDESFPETQILVGMKGESHYDAGYFYCPYWCGWFRFCTWC